MPARHERPLLTARALLVQGNSCELSTNRCYLQCNGGLLAGLPAT